MPFTDILTIFHWWSILFLIGLLFLPLTTKIFSLFFDKGYIFSRILGIILFSYVVLVIGMLHLLPFSFFTSMLLLLITAGVSFVAISFKRSKKFLHNFLFSDIKSSWKGWIGQELLFLAGLFFWSYIRAFSPDIHGLEKYMDFGFINSILRSTYFPPQDMWFTPFSINYYYFGHFVTAVLTKLSNIPSSITFNLMIATIFSLCFSACFSLGANLFTFFLQSQQDKFSPSTKKRQQHLKHRPFSRVLLILHPLIVGIIGALLVTVGGNLHILYAFFKPYPNENPAPLWSLVFSPNTFPNSYWYPNATRFIYNTIHEFPIYSWVVSDLHGHVLDIPFVLLTIALVAVFFFQKITSPKEQTLPRVMHSVPYLQPLFSQAPFTLWQTLLLGFMTAVMYMTNAWDGLIYLLLAGFAMLTLSWKTQTESFPSLVKQTQLLLLKVIPLGLVLGISFFVFSLPFSLTFKPFVSGIGVLRTPSFLLVHTNPQQTYDKRPLLNKLLLPDHCVSSMSEHDKMLVNGRYEERKIGPFLLEPDHCQTSPWWQLLILYGFFYFFVISYLIFLFKQKRLTASDSFVLLLIGLSTLLIILPEFIYVKDIYPAHYRANTMFKLCFQAFMMLGLCSSYILFRILSAGKQQAKWIGPRIIFFTISFSLIALVLMYPFLAIQSYYGELKPEQYKGLEGTKYLEVLYPTDYAAIQWLNMHISGQPVILEAQSDSYTDFGRVSSNTGLPTVLGWTVHEWLWRGTYDIPAPRVTEVQTLYETTDLTETKGLLNKYHVQLVFLGDLERQKYPTLDEQKWEKLGKVVFKKGATKIYKLN